MSTGTGVRLAVADKVHLPFPVSQTAWARPPKKMEPSGDSLPEEQIEIAKTWKNSSHFQTEHNQVSTFHSPCASRTGSLTMIDGSSY
jgi:hypothetical protein